MGGVLTSLLRGLRLRCPHCGEGRIFAAYLRMDDGCLSCSHIYQRDPGDWTGSAEITIILSVGGALAVAILLAYLTPLLGDMALLGVALLAWAAMFPVIFRRVKGLWVGLLYVWGGRCRVPEVSAQAKRELVRLKTAP